LLQLRISFKENAKAGFQDDEDLGDTAETVAFKL
jgi:hypothetical protein